MFDATAVYNKPDFCDFIITLKDGREIYCHKVILAAGSEMFRSFMDKDRLDDATIPFEDHAVEFCIKYIYGFRDVPPVMDLDITVQILTCSRYLLMDSLSDWITKNQIFQKCLESMPGDKIIERLHRMDERGVGMPEHLCIMILDKIARRLSVCYDEFVWTERGTPEPESKWAAEITQEFGVIAKLNTEIVDKFVKFLVEAEYYQTAIVLGYLHHGELSSGDSYHLTHMCDFYLDVMAAYASESDLEFITALKEM